MFGPVTSSQGGKTWFVTFMDDKSHRTWVHFMKSKGEVLDKFKEFKALVENETGRRIKMIRCDRGGEYVNGEFDAYLAKHGIARQLSGRDSPSQNGGAERLNRTIMEKARSMLYAVGLEIEFWAEAVATVVYLINRSPTKALNGMTPEEAWTGKKPSVAHLKVFGCLAYAHVPKDLRTKLAPKSVKCIFLGYYAGSKSYRLFNLDTKKVIRSRDVIFHEKIACSDVVVTSTYGDTDALSLEEL